MHSFAPAVSHLGSALTEPTEIKSPLKDVHKSDVNTAIQVMLIHEST